MLTYMCPAVAKVFAADYLPSGIAFVGPFRRATFPAYRVPDLSSRAFVIDEDSSTIRICESTNSLVTVPMFPILKNDLPSVTESALAVLDAASVFSSSAFSSISDFRHRAENFFGPNISILSGTSVPASWGTHRSKFIPSNSLGSVVYAFSNVVGVIVHGPSEIDFIQAGFLAFSDRSISGVVINAL